MESATLRTTLLSMAMLVVLVECSSRLGSSESGSFWRLNDGSTAMIATSEDSTMPDAYNLKATKCNCNATKLIMKDPMAGSSWLSVRFTSTAHPDCNLTSVKVVLYGPLDKPEMFDPPPLTEHEMKMSCFSGPDPDGYWLFNTNGVPPCPMFSVWPCSNFTLTMTPKYAACPANSAVATSLIVMTSPGSVEQPSSANIRDVGSDWLQLRWDDNDFCRDTLTSYWITIRTHIDPNLPLGPDEGPVTQTSQVPLSCTEDTGGPTQFDTRTCPSLFDVKPCTIYSAGIQAESWGTYNSSSSWTWMSVTLPPIDLQTTLDHVLTGSTWISFRWSISNPHCQSTLTGVQFTLTETRNGTRNTTVLDLSMTDCTFLTPDGESFIFNTSLPGCRNWLTIRPCTNYTFELVPQIFSSYYYSAKGSNSGKTIPGNGVSTLIGPTVSGADWVSFNWTCSECREEVTGFWMSISTASPSLSSLDAKSYQYLSMADCYPGLNAYEDIPFNSSMACLGWAEILPCSDYQVSIQPEFLGSFNGNINTTDVIDTLPGDVRTIIDSTLSGKDWISFQWQVDVATCRKKIDGVRVTIGPIGSRDIFHCNASSEDGALISLNTTDSCFNLTLISCLKYDIQVEAMILGGFIAGPGNASRMTTPGDDSTALISMEQYGYDWIYFHLESSAEGLCQRYLSRYILNVTDTESRTSQIRKISPNCSTSDDSYPFVLFNSTLPCANLKIFPCSNYSVAVIPEFDLDSVPFLGVQSYSAIGTQSGENGEIEQLEVFNQGLHSLELRWTEPLCKSSAALLYYNVAVNEVELQVEQDCLQPSGGDSVILTLNDTTCGQTDLIRLDSCSPYDIKILPVYKLASANEGIMGLQKSSFTLADKFEASVNNLTVDDTGTRWISLSWPKPQCRIPVEWWNLTERDSGCVSILPADLPILLNGTTFQLNVSDQLVCQNLQQYPILPCSSYFIQLDAKYTDLDIQPGTNNIVNASSETETPGVVTQLNWTGTAESIWLDWDPPEENPQCVSSYLVELNESSQTIRTKDTWANITELIPCSEYLVTVSSLPLKSGKVSSAKVNVYTDGVYPAPVSSEINVTYVDDGTRNVSWLVPLPDYCIAGYNVLVYEMNNSTIETVVVNRTNEGKFSTWVVLDEGFERKKSYAISIASYSDFLQSNLVGNASTKVFTWDSASEMMNIMPVIYAVIFSFVFLFLALVAFVIFRRRRMQPAEPAIITIKNIPRVVIGRKPIALDDMNYKIKLMKADSCYEMSREFEGIKNMSKHWDIAWNVAQLPENRDKNRYGDILPYDHSRVKLNWNGHSSIHSDYINASFISGFDGNRAYIATQGPKPNTLNDFWRMCLEQDVKVIVALTGLEERGRVKCAQYWPTEGSIEYGDIQVHLTSEVHQGPFTIRDFLVSDRSCPSSLKSIRQLHHTEWPDFGCPEDMDYLVEFINRCRDENLKLNVLKDSHQNPLLVHCSAGVGRTGTFIALDILMEQARRKKAIDVVGTVLNIRKDRVGMVQTEEQYQLLYKCLERYIQKDLHPQQLTDLPGRGIPMESRDSLSSGTITPILSLKRSNRTW